MLRTLNEYLWNYQVSQLLLYHTGSFGSKEGSPGSLICCWGWLWVVGRNVAPDFCHLSICRSSLCFFENSLLAVDWVRVWLPRGTLPFMCCACYVIPLVSTGVMLPAVFTCSQGDCCLADYLAGWWSVSQFSGSQRMRKDHCRSCSIDYCQISEYTKQSLQNLVHIFFWMFRTMHSKYLRCYPSHPKSPSPSVLRQL